MSRTSKIVEFSVIIPLYNKERSICSTIESVLNQTYPFFELIIVDDGSTDNSLAAVSAFDDPRIKIFNKPNGGVSSARNKGIEISQAQYIVFLDADDLWLPFCLEEFYDLIITFPEAEVFCTNYNMTGKKLNGSDLRYYVTDYFFLSAYYLAKWSIPLMITGCVTISRAVFREVGYFNELITHGEDIDMWDRVTKYCKLAKSEKVTTIYRTDTENRASLQNVRIELKSDQFDITRNKVLTNSQRIYYGIQFVIKARERKFTKDGLQSLGKIIKYPDWVIRGIIFILKVRIFNTKPTNFL